MEEGTLTALSAVTTGQWLQAFKASQIVPWPYLGQFAISPHQRLDEEFVFRKIVFRNKRVTVCETISYISELNALTSSVDRKSVIHFIYHSQVSIHVSEAWSK